MLRNKTSKNTTHQCYDGGTSSSTSHNEQMVRHVELEGKKRGKKEHEGKKHVKNTEVNENYAKCISTVLEDKDNKSIFIAGYSKL